MAVQGLDVTPDAAGQQILALWHEYIINTIDRRGTD